MSRRRFRYASIRPTLEHLEARLPPGDALLGMLVAWPESQPATFELETEIHSALESEVADTPARFISRSDPDEPTATSVEPMVQSSEIQAAGLIPAVYTAGINPAARFARSRNVPGSSAESSFVSADFSRIAGPIPALAGASAKRSIAPLLRTVGAPLVDSQTDAKTPDVLGDHSNLPLTFEANHGQTDSRVDFITRAGGATVFLTPMAAVFSMQSSELRIQNSESSKPASGVASAPRDRPELRALTQPGSPEEVSGVALYMEIVGGNPDAEPVAQHRQPGIVNYFIGNDPSQWHANTPTFGRVEYQDVYPGIDLAYYGGQSRDGNGAGLEYDFIVSPGADPTAIKLNFAGSDGVELNRRGDLVVHTAAGEVVQQKPYLYQEIDGSRHEISGNFVVGASEVTFAVGDYDATRPLVIDPLVLGYSTYLGGSGFDVARGIAVDDTGNAYVTGSTSSGDFPTTPGAFQTTYQTHRDAYVTKLDLTGSALVFSTYLGGARDDFTQAIAVDAVGSAYLSGRTESPNFPTTPGAFDTTFNGSEDDGFVAKLDPTGGALAYSTFLGGSGDGDERTTGIAVDLAGGAYVGGTTPSADFPTTPGAFDTTYNEGGFYGYDTFVTKLSVDGSALAYSTFLGGSQDDPGGHLAVDGKGGVYVTGLTRSADFPTTPGAFDTTFNGPGDGYVAKLNDTGSSLVYSTYLGGNGNDSAFGVAVDGAGKAYVTGGTAAADFPTTPDAFDSTYNGGSGFLHDLFVAKLNGAGSALMYSTYLGGSDDELGTGFGQIVLDSAGNVYIGAATDSTDFPTTPGAFDETYNGENDAFVAKFCQRACRVPVEAKPVMP